MRIPCLAALCLWSLVVRGQDIPSFVVPNDCRQVVLVVAPNWSAVNATLQRLERSTARKEWLRVGASVPVLLGRRGLGWAGDSAPPEKGAPQKTEGDERSPAGVFTLGTAFGRAARGQVAWIKLPYRQLSATTEAVDDPESHYYDRIVDRESVARPDWRSSEHMGRISAYELGAVIDANPEHRRHGGSCIFLHLWLDGWKGTAGCTALHRADLVDLLRWLDPGRRPLLVQGTGKSFKF